MPHRLLTVQMFENESFEQTARVCKIFLCYLSSKQNACWIMILRHNTHTTHIYTQCIMVAVLLTTGTVSTSVSQFQTEMVAPDHSVAAPQASCCMQTIGHALKVSASHMTTTCPLHITIPGP